jgi:hypothetical protein
MYRSPRIAALTAFVALCAWPVDSARAQSNFASGWEVFGQLNKGTPAFGKPIQVAPGTASYVIMGTDEDGDMRNRWGDYSATTVDPNDKTFWTVQEFALKKDTWSTEIIHTGFDGKVINMFQGLSMTGNPPLVPPDTMGAAGPKSFMETLNNQYDVFSPQGKSLMRQTPADFWKAALTNAGLGQAITNDPFDPRVLYDPVGKHWYISALTKSIGGTLVPGNDVLIGVSATSDPTGKWSGYAIAVPANRAADFDTLGINKTDVYVSVNNFSFATGKQAYVDNSIYDITKNSMGKVGIVPTLASLVGVTPAQAGASVQPVVDSNGDLTAKLKGEAFLAADLNNQGSQLFRQVLANGMLQANPTAIGMKAYGQAPGAPQPNTATPIDTGDLRLSSNVVFADGYLWAVQTVADPKTKLADIRWLQISADANNPKVVNEGLISDPKFAFYDGSIAVNADGKILIGFSGSAVPEPNSLILLVAGLLGIATGRSLCRRRRVPSGGAAAGDRSI